MNLPTHSEILSIAERLTRVEMTLDDLDGIRIEARPGGYDHPHGGQAPLDNGVGCQCGAEHDALDQSRDHLPLSKNIQCLQRRAPDLRYAVGQGIENPLKRSPLTRAESEALEGDGPGIRLAASDTGN